VDAKLLRLSTFSGRLTMLKLESMVATAWLGGLCLVSSAATCDLVTLSSAAFENKTVLASSYLANNLRDDGLSFNIDTCSSASVSALQPSAIPALAISNFSGVMQDISNGAIDTLTFPQNSDFLTLLNWKVVLNSDDFKSDLTGKVKLDPTTYLGTVSGSPAPESETESESETYAMLLAGLCVVGFVARRRRPSSQP